MQGQPHRPRALVYMLVRDAPSMLTKKSGVAGEGTGVRQSTKAAGAKWRASLGQDRPVAIHVAITT